MPLQSFTFPTLRGLRNFGNERDTKGKPKEPFFERTKSDYFAQNAPDIFLGLTCTATFKSCYWAILPNGVKFVTSKKLLSESFFDGTPVALIPKLESTVLDIKIGDEAERPIYLLGDRDSISYRFDLSTFYESRPAIASFLRRAGAVHAP